MEPRTDHALRETLKDAVFITHANEHGEELVHIAFNEPDAAMRVREALEAAYPDGKTVYVGGPDPVMPFYEIRLFGNNLGPDADIPQFVETYRDVVKGVLEYPDGSGLITDQAAKTVKKDPDYEKTREKVNHTAEVLLAGHLRLIQ